MLTLLLISLGIFLTYNIFIIAKFGVPNSLSDSFYLLNSVKNNLGYVFTLVLYSMSFLLLPSWFNINPNPDLDFLIFWSGAMLAFVGAAPAFRGIDKEWHGRFAKASAVAGFLWIIFATPYWYVLLLSGGVMMGAMLITGTKKALTYWLEMIMFAAIYAVGLIYYLK